MGYILVQPEVLKSAGINYFKTIPDGRGIADFSLLKVLGSVSGVDIVGSATELKKLIAQQEAEGITPPMEDDTDDLVTEVNDEVITDNTDDDE